MKFKMLLGLTLAAAGLWASAASACLPPLRETTLPREAGESDAAYQARIEQGRARAAAAVEAQALAQQESLWDTRYVTRLAVVDVVEVAGPEAGAPPMGTMDFTFRVVTAQRGMAANERFTLTEPTWSSRPCVPVTRYPLGQRYILFTNDQPISRSSMIFYLLPAEAIRSERGLALLRAAEQRVPAN
jgi:hypothetical protein